MIDEAGRIWTHWIHPDLGTFQLSAEEDKGQHVSENPWYPAQKPGIFVESGQSDQISKIHKLKDEIDEKNEFINELKEKVGELKNKYQDLEQSLKKKQEEGETLDKLGKLKR